MRFRQPHRFHISLFLLSFFFFGQSQADTSEPSKTPEDRCMSALGTQDVRLASASFGSSAVRKATCACLLAPREQAGSTTQSLVLQCLSATSPSEKDITFSDAAIARIGKALSLESSDGEFIEAKLDVKRCKQPEYPKASRRSDIDGESMLSILVDKRGRVRDGTVIKSAGPTPAHKLLDVTALFTLMQCPFDNATYREKPLESWTEIRYVWKLE